MGGYELSWIAVQVIVVILSSLFLYGLYRILYTRVDGDEQILDALRRAEQMEEKARQRSLKVLNRSLDLETRCEPEF